MNITLGVILILVVLLFCVFIAIIEAVRMNLSKKNKRRTAQARNVPHVISRSGTIDVSIEKYDTEAVRKVGDKGRVHIPSDIRLMLNIQDGDYIRFAVENDRIIGVKHEGKINE